MTTAIPACDTRRLLIVEDAPDVLVPLRHLLEHPQVEVHIATNGVEAVARAREVRPHAIVLDVRLPGMDGFEVFHILRREPELRHARVIFITAVAEDGALVLAKELGAYACLRKPFDEFRLQMRVFEALGILGAEESKRRTSEETARRVARFAAGPRADAGRPPEVVLAVGLEGEVAALKRRLEERSPVRAVPVVTDGGAVKLGRSPHVRAIIVETPPAGLSLEQFARYLRAEGVEAPLVHVGQGAPPPGASATLSRDPAPGELSRLLAVLAKAKAPDGDTAEMPAVIPCTAELSGAQCAVQSA